MDAKASLEHYQTRDVTPPLLGRHGKGKGVAKDAGEKEAPKSKLAARRTQLAYFPSTVDAVHLRDYFKPLWGCKTKGHPATRIIPAGFAEAIPNRYPFFVD